MALMNVKPTVSPLTPAALPNDALLSQHETFKTAVENTRITAPDSLLAYMEGMAFPVNYFAQLVSEHDNVKELDLGGSPAYQQYRRINKLELRLQSSLTHSFSQDTGTTTITGTAIVPFIIPNTHDYFIAEAGINEIGIFRVTGYERKSYHSKSVYQIDFACEGFVRDKQSLYDGLIQRGIQSFQFIKDRVIQGMDPLLTSNDHASSIELKESMAQIAREYFARFVDPRQSLLRYPSNESYIYDTRLVTFITSVVDSGLYNKLYELNVVSADNDPHLNHPCLFQVLASRNWKDLAYCHKKAFLFPRSQSPRNSFLRGTLCWSIDNYVYPKIDTTGFLPNGTDVYQYPFDSDQLPTGEAFTGPVDVNNILTASWNFVDYLGEPTRMIHAVHTDSFYVLSEGFYENQPGLSLLEILVRDYIHREALNLDLLKLVVSHYAQWPAIEKFYYTPLLFVLIKDAIRGFY